MLMFRIKKFLTHHIIIKHKKEQRVRILKNSRDRLAIVKRNLGLWSENKELLMLYTSKYKLQSQRNQIQGEQILLADQVSQECPLFSQNIRVPQNLFRMIRINQLLRKTLEIKTNRFRFNL